MFSFLKRVSLFVLAIAIVTIATLFAQQSASSPASPSLDYAFFRDQVQPIFLKKRPGHARCVTCHRHRSPNLVHLEEGATGWSEEESRQNFAMWSQFVVPGEPTESRMLLHPLAKQAGGDGFHAGGKHWDSPSDPEWQTLAAWVNGQTNGGAK